MTKKELFNKIKAKSNLSTKDCNAFYNAFVEIIIDGLNEGDTISLQGLGKFLVKTRKSRTIKHLQSEKLIKIPTKHIPTFKAGKAFKDCIR